MVNFGCIGATSNSMILSVGCTAQAKNATRYTTTTQTAAAVAFINAHKGQIGLVKISIGINDFGHCFAATSIADCLNGVMSETKSNATYIANKLRDAAGPIVPMIATSYPDTTLGAYLNGGDGIARANASALAYSQIINPKFEAAYRPSNTSFINITSQMNANTALTQTTTLSPYGTIPVAVAKVCTYTWYCTNGDIHPKPAGYTFMANSIATEFLRVIALKKTAAPVGRNVGGAFKNNADGGFNVLMDVVVPKGDTLLLSTIRLCGPSQVAPKCSTMMMSVPGVGTFGADTTGGAISYWPTAGYVGTSPKIYFQLFDAFGQVVKGSATFYVMNP